MVEISGITELLEIGEIPRPHSLEVTLNPSPTLDNNLIRKDSLADPLKIYTKPIFVVGLSHKSVGFRGLN